MAKSTEGLSVKQLGLKGNESSPEIKIGSPAIDFVVKLLLEPGETGIRIRKVSSFNAVNIANVELQKDISHRVLFRGKGYLESGKSYTDLVLETVDAGVSFFGISPIQIKRIGQMLLEKTKITGNDGVLNVRAPLKIDGKVIGEATYKVKKYNSLQDLNMVEGDLLRTIDFRHQSQMGEKPALISDLKLDLDTSLSPVIKEKLIQVNIGEGLRVDNLKPDGFADAFVTAQYLIDVKNASSLKNKKGTLRLSLGEFTYETLTRSTGPTEQEF